MKIVRKGTRKGEHTGKKVKEMCRTSRKISALENREKKNRKSRRVMRKLLDNGPTMCRKLESGKN
jgi:hypothetical protein